MMKRQATPEFDWLDDRRGRWLHFFGRIRPGVTAEQAKARLQPWLKGMLEEEAALRVALGVSGGRGRRPSSCRFFS